MLIVYDVISFMAFPFAVSFSPPAPHKEFYSSECSRNVHTTFITWCLRRRRGGRKKKLSSRIPHCRFESLFFLVLLQTTPRPAIRTHLRYKMSFIWFHVSCEPVEEAKEEVEALKWRWSRWCVIPHKQMECSWWCANRSWAKNMLNNVRCDSTLYARRPVNSFSPFWHHAVTRNILISSRISYV